MFKWFFAKPTTQTPLIPMLGTGPVRVGGSSVNRFTPQFERGGYVQQLVSKLALDMKSNPLRQEYESRVAGLSVYKSEHEIIRRSFRDNSIANVANLPGSERLLAIKAHAARRDLGVEYKNLTPTPLRDYIYDVNMRRYGDPLGPSVELLTQRGKTYQQIIYGASRPNPDVDVLLKGLVSGCQNSLIAI